ncbi:hypothetical protein PSE10B_08680 [Pseudomonas amygdali pv. eriobotryae]|uniref:Uncharacterized protein n=1 Tax=Pseudomonas amygdali pv. photiniae TaxID=251724 RepID=A0A658K6D9_PSEA0|nr:hypothetical protein [Pseudomonas amygdali]RMS44968.1 hypothetical protein ALP66_01787 [Pseudomonas amygdali pv. photiniae]KPX91518.1 Uncharacterized protein ALO62_03416 [Pseudomonas amygdali pv. myricae]KWS44047.1 hypothetical protein AL057_11620 [Pseudomonas amygdali pv. myricae]RMT45156.1 hypothetical protein ALP46_100476 [Pseudomonas amygdali pv. myricae]RMU96887.1 hypothetical protein ALP18_100392 [Pseudomonas amygdali pv. myricae]
MTVNPAASPAAAALPSPGGGGVPQASQNLFEHMAETSKGMPQGASPHQIGSNLMERLDGFIDRSRQFSERADALTQGNALQSDNHAPSPATSAAQAPGKVGEPQVDRIVQSLGRMFDYSIETQMVVRGATQISGSANTLLKGQ